MPRISRVLIVGGGGVGTIAGYNLDAGKLAAVTMVLRSSYPTVSSRGFQIDSCDHGKITGWLPSGGVRSAVPDVLDGNEEPYDFILVCTKSLPDVPPLAVDIVRPAVTPGYSTLILIQNGFDIEKSMLAAFPQNICLSGVSYCGAEESSTGIILHNASDRMKIGAFTHGQNSDEQQQKTLEFVRLYSASQKVQCEFDADVAAARWRKLLYNAVYNPICALTNLDTTRLRLSAVGDDSGLDIATALLRPAMNEIRAAAFAASNVSIDEQDVDAMIRADPIDAFIRPSMQQDISRGRLIEHESLLGAALRAGTQAGVEMPVIRTLYSLCKVVQFRTREAHRLVDISTLLKNSSL